MGLPHGAVVKNPPIDAQDARDGSTLPGSGRCPGEGHSSHSSTLAWRIPWIEPPGGLQSMGPQRVRHDRLCTHAHACTRTALFAERALKDMINVT